MASNGVASYHYEPLQSDNHIRLLKPPSGKELVFTLIQCPLESAPPFLALSYTWGSPVLNKSIQVEGRRVNITTSLHDALSHVDYYVSRHNRYLWVDAICINQADIAERNHQVTKIRSIFQHAEKVLAWLGDSADDSDLAMQRMLDWKEHYSWWGSVSVEEAYKRLLANKAMFWGPKGSEQRQTWEAIKKLCARDWWSRAWILPEATANAKTHIICGDYYMPWGGLHIAFRIAQFLTDDFLPAHIFDDLAATSAWRLVRLRNREGGFKELKSNLLERVRSFRHARCADPRDKIYAALNMEAITTSKLQPDYGASIQQVYVDFVRQWIKDYRSTGHGLDFLAYTSCYTPNGIDEAFPSWLPDWRRRETCTPFGKFFRVDDLEKTVYNAGGSKCESEICGDFLKTKGLVVDTVETCQTPPDVEDNQEFLKGIRKLLPVDADEQYPGGRTVLHAFLRTITANVKRDLHVVYDAPYIVGSISRLDDLLAPWNVDDPQWESRKWLNISILQATRGRSLIRTQKRYIGLAQEGVRAGDKICVFYGGQMAYILRPTSESADSYNFIGEAYLDGFMHGAALELEKNGELKPQTFILV